MRIVIALGGNALLRKEQSPTVENQLNNIKQIAPQLARLAKDHQVIITHGNGPQIGFLALQSAANPAVAPYPLDILGAQSDGMIGYMLEQEIANLLPIELRIATLLTRVEVDPKDIAFSQPTKPIGPHYSQEAAETLAKVNNWTLAPVGKLFRRVVASPKPLRVLGIDAVRGLINQNFTVIAAGGGGIPVALQPNGSGYLGIDAVIDKDLCSSMLAKELEADCLIIGTDVEAIFVDWQKSTQYPLRRTTPEQLDQHCFAQGSMGPKVRAASDFVRATNKRALIGSITHIQQMLAGTTGTDIRNASMFGT